MKIKAIEVFSFGLVVLIFILDLFLPLGITVGSLYMFCILLISRSSPKLIAWLSGIIVVLIALKYFIYLDENTLWFYFVNRIVSIIVVTISCIYSISISLNLMEGTKAKEIFDEKEKNFNLLIENMIEGAQIISRDWRYLYVNKSLTRQVNLNKEELIGKKMEEVYPGIEKTHMFKQLEIAMNESKSMMLYNEFKFPDGSIDFFELIIQPIPEGLFIMSMVINDRVKMDLERKKYVEQLEEMLYMTSHMIRQPVTNIVGLTESLDLHENLSIEEIKQLNFIKKSALDLDEFTHDLNDFILNTIRNNQKKYIDTDHAFTSIREDHTFDKP